VRTDVVDGLCATGVSRWSMPPTRNSRGWLTWPAWICAISPAAPTSFWADAVTVWSTLVAMPTGSSILSGPRSAARGRRPGWPGGPPTAVTLPLSGCAKLRIGPLTPRLHERRLGGTVSTVVAPFFAGLLLEDPLASPARLVDLLIRAFVRGAIGLPAYR
jgi:hypothetical protein